MKLKHTISFIPIFLFLFILSFSFTVRFPATNNSSVKTILGNWYVARIDSVITALKEMDFFLQAKSSSKKNHQLKKLFENIRYQYKQAEFLVEFSYPYDARLLNGPLVPEVEGDDLSSEPVHYPEGFQLAESLIYNYPETDADSLRIVFSRIKNNLQHIRELVNKTGITPEVFMLSVRLENERIILFNITGFDNSFSKLGISESFYSLKGIKEGITALYAAFQKQESEALQNFLSKIDEASAYLENHSLFDEFDRVEYITRFYLPLAADLKKIQHELEIQYPMATMGFNLRATNIFEEEAINRQVFSSYPSLRFNDKQAAIGKILFFDPILSGNIQRACASCHNPTAGLGGKMPKNLSFEHNGMINRNTPTLLNVVLQQKFFMDSRARSLEQQLEDVLTNKTEMHTDLEETVSRLNESEEYRELFKDAFMERYPGKITPELIKQSIVSFELTLISLNSDFDKFMRGDSSKLNINQKNGFNLFSGKAKCATCHYIPLFNGTVPPSCLMSESEVIGTTEKFDTIAPVSTSDSGKFLFTKIPFQLFAFKTPTVRNIDLTAPYMHNGNFKSLEEVMHFYNKGGGAGLGLDIPNQTLDPAPLNLSEQEMKDIISFLKSLTDTSCVPVQPSSLPQFSNRPEWNQRKPGGEY